MNPVVPILEQEEAEAWREYKKALQEKNEAEKRLADAMVLYEEAEAILFQRKKEWVDIAERLMEAQRRRVD